MQACCSTPFCLSTPVPPLVSLLCTRGGGNRFYAPAPTPSTQHGWSPAPSKGLFAAAPLRPPPSPKPAQASSHPAEANSRFPGPCRLGNRSPESNKTAIIASPSHETTSLQCRSAQSAPGTHRKRRPQNRQERSMPLPTHTPPAPIHIHSPNEPTARPTAHPTAP